MRRALGEPSLELVLEACRSAVTSCFDAAGMWLTAFHDDGEHTTTSYAVGSDATPPFSEIDDVVIGLAHRYWADQYVAHFSHAHADQPGLPAADAERLLAFLDRIGIGSVLFVPLGAGPECLGFLVLTRVSDTPEWTPLERDAALDIGRDLGRAVANARQLERERAVADHLRRIDGYRMEMVNTLGHELRTPLFSMTANLELLDVDSLGPEDQRSVAAASRGAERMRAVIEDLLTMAQVADPQREFVPEQVDLRRVLLDVAEECHHAAAAKSQDCRDRRARASRCWSPAAPTSCTGCSPTSRATRSSTRPRARRSTYASRDVDGRRAGLLRRLGHRHLRARPGPPVPRVLPLHQPPRAGAARHRHGPGDRRPHRAAPLRPRRGGLASSVSGTTVVGDPARAATPTLSASTIVMKVLCGSST